MATKVYADGNYIVISGSPMSPDVDLNDAKDNVTCHPLADDKFLLSSDKIGDHVLTIGDITDGDDVLYTESSFKEFFRANTGNFSSPNSSNDFTGWASYSDTEYSVGSQFSITGGASAVPIPNNAGNVLDIQKPIDIESFYSAGKITGREGDGINITMSFAVTPTTGAVTRVTVYPDIGGAIGPVDDYKLEYIFSKGNGIEQRFMRSFDAYTLDTWEANGATMYVEADGNCDIYNIRYLITRTHKAR